MFDTFGIEPRAAGRRPGHDSSLVATGLPICSRAMPLEHSDHRGHRGPPGGNAHAANEFFVIEGADKVYGMAGAEKSSRDGALQLRGSQRSSRASKLMQTASANE